MGNHYCDVCGYYYKEADGDPLNGVSVGTKFEDLPADYKCPMCGQEKKNFKEDD